MMDAKERKKGLLNHITNGVEMILSSVGELKSNGEDRQDTIQLYEKEIKKLVYYSTQIEQYGKNLNQFEASIQSGVVPDDMETALSEIVPNMAYEDQVVNEQHDFIQQFKSAAGLNGDEEDVCVEEDMGERSTICPFTTGEFETPVRSESCSHTFTKEAVEAYLRSKKQSRRPAVCPIVGCNKVIGELVRDIEMEIRMAQKKQAMQQSNRNRIVQEIDDEIILH